MPRVYAQAVLETRTTLNALDCPACGGVFAIPAELEEQARLDHRNLHCPNGHTWGWYGKTKAERERAREAAVDPGGR
jgi:hypothetical protein